MTDMFASESRVPGGAPAQGTPQPGDVAGALTELERKLSELQQELSSIGRRRETGEPALPPTAPPAGGRIIDEAVERPTPSPVERPAPSPLAPAPTSTVPSGSAPRPGDAPAATPSGSAIAAGGPANAASGSAARPGDAPAAAPGDARLESLAELRRFRDRLERFGRELATEYDALLGRVMAGLSGAPSAGAQAPPADSPAPAPPVSAQDARESALFEGRVELGVGPFYDIGALGAFEQRLTSLPGVSEASVRRFEASHAVVDIRLAAPVALVKELRHALSTDFNVREVAGGRILLTFDEA